MKKTLFSLCIIIATASGVGQSYAMACQIDQASDNCAKYCLPVIFSPLAYALCL